MSDSKPKCIMCGNPAWGKTTLISSGAGEWVCDKLDCHDAFKEAHRARLALAMTKSDIVAMVEEFWKANKPL